MGVGGWKGGREAEKQNEKFQLWILSLNCSEGELDLIGHAIKGKGDVAPQNIR